MASEEKKGFVLYYDYAEHLKILTDEERGKLLMALIEYGSTGEKPKLEGAALMAFSFITLQMDRDAEKYAAKCKKRSEAGKQGGRPRKAKASEDGEKKPTESKKKQSKAKKANAFSEKQSKAKKADTETDTDTDTDKETDTDTTTPPTPPPRGEGEPPSSPAEPDAADITPYLAIINLYHGICKSYPKLRGVSANRKKAIAARWKEYEHSLDTFRELFEKAEASKFLKGESDSTRKWSADFNWLMNSENMAKVLEGKYDNPKHEGSFDTDDFFEAALRKGFSTRREDPPPTAADSEEIRRRGEELRALLGST